MASSTPERNPSVYATGRELRILYHLSRDANNLLLAVLIIAFRERGGVRAVRTIRDFATDFEIRQQIGSYLAAHSKGMDASGAALFHLLTDKRYLSPLIREFVARQGQAHLSVFDTFLDED
jgi:hypothetical protein